MKKSKVCEVCEIKGRLAICKGCQKRVCNACYLDLKGICFGCMSKEEIKQYTFTVEAIKIV